MGIQHRRAKDPKRRDSQRRRMLLQLAHREQAADGQRDEHAVHPRPSRDDQRNGIEGPQRRGNQRRLGSEQLGGKREDQHHAGEREGSRECAQDSLAGAEEAAVPMQREGIEASTLAGIELQAGLEDGAEAGAASDVSAVGLGVIEAGAIQPEEVHRHGHHQHKRKPGRDANGH